KALQADIVGLGAINWLPRVKSRGSRVVAPAMLLAAVLSASESVARAQWNTEITPSQVFQQTRRIISKIRRLRVAQGATDIPRDPAVQAHKYPIHVYAKCLEVLEKVTRFEADLGLSPGALGQIPIARVRPAEVFNCTQDVLHELDRISGAVGLAPSDERFPLLPGKAPADVYRNMWRASFLLDGVVGQVSPSYVYRNTQYILSELDLIAATLGVHLAGRAPEPQPDRMPVDVNLQGFMVLYVLASIERALGIAPLVVGDFPPGSIQPSDVYDTTGTIMAELVRIKAKLGITAQRATLAVLESTDPPHVHAQMVLIRNRVETLRASLQATVPRPPVTQ
ncbi:MAG: hypothetical protein OXU20_14870, partial [Myxococcales bacterium]|nr:hypothetical protein [Myxococcales bacterium]